MNEIQFVVYAWLWNKRKGEYERTALMHFDNEREARELYDRTEITNDCVQVGIEREWETKYDHGYDRIALKDSTGERTESDW